MQIKEGLVLHGIKCEQYMLDLLSSLATTVKLLEVILLLSGFVILVLRLTMFVYKIKVPPLLSVKLHTKSCVFIRYILDAQVVRCGLEEFNKLPLLEMFHDLRF